MVAVLKRASGETVSFGQGAKLGDWRLQAVTGDTARLARKRKVYTLRIGEAVRLAPVKVGAPTSAPSVEQGAVTGQ